MKTIYFLCGSQHLYGQDTLNQVKKNAKEICEGLNTTTKKTFFGDLQIRFIGLGTTAKEIRQLLFQAQSDTEAIGLITWMHTFSPAKMWIGALNQLQLPLLHLHTQYSESLPYDSIDMNYMNTHQSAHGDREFGFISTRMGIRRKVVVGHWKNPEIQSQISDWSRACLGAMEARTLEILRIGDNMREVAVTDGNKVSAEIHFGFRTNSYGIGDLVNLVKEVSESEIQNTLDAYHTDYEVLIKKSSPEYQSVIEAAKIELALKKLIARVGAGALTDTFEDLHGLHQLPGLPIQRLMEEGFGFAGEGDWKTAALVRVLKTMAGDSIAGTSFMEDYTYHFGPGQPLVLGAHMLEICPSIIEPGKKAKLEVHPLGIGGKADPARLVFNGAAGKGFNVSLIEIAGRFRMLISEVNSVKIKEELPKLPVARTLWEVKPDLSTGAAAWIQAGGAHHTVYTQALNLESLLDLAEIWDIEALVIDERTELRSFMRDLKLGEKAWA